MDDTGQDSGKPGNENPRMGPHGLYVRLLLIPFLVYCVWMLETFLLEGSLLLFLHYQPLLLLMYTLVAGIFVGTFAPVFLLKSAFLSGAVNMYQIGFRSLRRTLLTAGITASAGYLVLAAANPLDSSGTSLPGTFLLMLPIAISSVMICWVLAGTHLQAYVRHHGALASIVSSVLVTGLLFALSFIAHSPPLSDPRLIPAGICIGIASAMFFFSVRDVYSAAVFVAFSLAWVVQGQADPPYVSPISPFVAGTALLSFLSLAACQWYLSRHFITVRLPPDAVR